MRLVPLRALICFEPRYCAVADVVTPPNLHQGFASFLHQGFASFASCAQKRAKQSSDPNAQLLAERRINEYLRREVDDLRNSLRQIGRAINAEAEKELMAKIGS
jgi:hypothetical protein